MQLATMKYDDCKNSKSWKIASIIMKKLWITSLKFETLKHYMMIVIYDKIVQYTLQ